MIEEETTTSGDVENPPVDVDQTEATTTDTPEPEAKKETTEEEKPKRNGVQKRINELTREKYELQQKLEESERQKQKPVEVDNAPKRDDFDSYEDYIRADAQFVARQEAKKAMEAEREASTRQKTEEEERSLYAQYEARKEAARDKYEDFDDVIYSTDAPVTPSMARAIMESEVGADVMYYLGNHPEEATRISKLSPVSQLREMGKLELKINEPVKPSAAPEPIDPVKPNSANDNPDPSEKDSDEEWLRKRRKQVYG